MSQPCGDGTPPVQPPTSEPSEGRLRVAWAEVQDGEVVSGSNPRFKAVMERLLAKCGVEGLRRLLQPDSRPSGAER